MRPFFLTRTPYGAEVASRQGASAHLGALIDGSDVADDVVATGGYIRVFAGCARQVPIRRRLCHDSAAEGPLNSTEVDHSTDAYDTIEWLVNNMPQSNGKVGMLGISYDGFTTLMALVNPHPALKAAVPINSMVDGWMGDDWFHKGAFRLDTFRYVQEQEGGRHSEVPTGGPPTTMITTLGCGRLAGDIARQHGLEQLGFAVKLMSIRLRCVLAGPGARQDTGRAAR